MVPNTLRRAAAVTGCRRLISGTSDVRPQPARRPSPQVIRPERGPGRTKIALPTAMITKPLGEPGISSRRCMSPLPTQQARHWPIPLRAALHGHRIIWHVLGDDRARADFEDVKRAVDAYQREGDET